MPLLQAKHSRQEACKTDQTTDTTQEFLITDMIPENSTKLNYLFSFTHTMKNKPPYFWVKPATDLSGMLTSPDFLLKHLVESNSCLSWFSYICRSDVRPALFQHSDKTKLSKHTAAILVH